MTRLTRHLQMLSLNLRQAAIYELLLREGAMRVSEITRRLRMPRSSVYECLKALQSRGLTEETVAGAFRWIRPASLDALKHELHDKKAHIEAQSAALAQLEMAAERLRGTALAVPTAVRYYEGREGARQLLWHTLKAQDEIYVYSEWGRGRYVGMKFYENFVRESHARTVREKVLTNATPRVLDSIRTYTGSPVSRTRLERVRAMEKEQVPFHGETFMYGNVYAQVFLKHERISGFEIESGPFVLTQRAIFERLWATARPVSALLADGAA